MTYTYHLFGLTLQSTIAIPNQIEAPGASPDVVFTCIDAPAKKTPQIEGDRLFISELQTPDGEPYSALYRAGDALILRIAGVADYHVRGNNITAQLHDASRAPWVESFLLSSGLGLWQELRGVPTLHASVVSVGGKAVAFLAHSGQGKSALAATIVQAGYPLIADDNLHIEAGSQGVYACPGYPQMRMWPDEADWFLGYHAGLAPVIPGFDKRRVPVGNGGFGHFCDTTQPLACLYLPERCEGSDHPVEIEALNPAEAVMALVRHLFMPRTVRALGLQASRLSLFASMVERIPVRKLRYPSGFAHLDQVKTAVLADQERLERA